MFTTDLYLDHLMEQSELADAFAEAAGIWPNRVIVLPKEEVDRLGTLWEEGWPKFALRLSGMRGDFPVAIELIARSAAFEWTLRDSLSTLARKLGVSILTDELDVNPLFVSEWLMFAPDGASFQVEIDDEEFDAEEPAIILTPASRDLYKAHQPGSGSLASTA
jgi:hypothetical protein